MMRDARLYWVALALVAAGLGCNPAESRENLVPIVDGALQIPAVVFSKRFEEDAAMAGYHLLAWEDGPKAGHALFRTPVSELQFLEALESMGAVPGEALGAATWDERNDPSSAAPDGVIEGPGADIHVRVPGRERSLRLVDGRDRGFDMRFGAHRDNIAWWRSGCLVCLYSCPASKAGNAAYTVRDFINGATRFHVRGHVLPEDGTEVTMVFRLVEQAPEP